MNEYDIIYWFFYLLKDGIVNVSNSSFSNCCSSRIGGGGFLMATGEGGIKAVGCSFTTVVQRGESNGMGGIFIPFVYHI
jgi:hypothetical protein